MKKIVCISSVLLLIQSCVGMQKSLTAKYCNIAQLDAKYSDQFLKYCMLHIDYKIKRDDFCRIASGADYVFNYTNSSLELKTEDVQSFIKSAIAYFKSAYEVYKNLPSSCKSCSDVGNHPHLTYKPEEEFLFRFILETYQKPAS